MSITEKEVKHVANLAKLSFKEEEIHGFSETFGKIIDLFEELKEVDTTGVPFTSNVVHDISVLREDVAEKGTDRELLMKNVPERQGEFIKVPAILDEDTDA